MLNLAPWYYKKFFTENDIINKIEYFEIDLITKVHQFEAVAFLKDNLVPNWVGKSQIYKNCDGSGTSSHKNIAVYKSISEALERLAYYQLVDSDKYAFHLNPSTTGMAAFPHFVNKNVRRNAKAEAIERWALIQFNYGKLPINLKKTDIPNLNHYEIITPFNDVKVSLLSYKKNDFFAYGFAGGENLYHSFDRALIELDRNIRVLNGMYKNPKNYFEFTTSVDRTISYFSTNEGFCDFEEKIKRAASKIKINQPRVLCDEELKGHWSKYATVWRYLLEDSYYECRYDHKFFMF